MVMDLQRVESRVMRAVLDSLGQSMFPRTAVVLGQANLADVRQTAIGSIIRVAQQGAVQELDEAVHRQGSAAGDGGAGGDQGEPDGDHAGEQGLTVDELQSTAPVAVSQQTSAAQDRLDMVAQDAGRDGAGAAVSPGC